MRKLSLLLLACLTLGIAQAAPATTNAAQQVSDPIEAETPSITWTFDPVDGLEFPGGGEGWIYLTPTQIPEEYVGKNPVISLNIEGSKADEVKVCYLTRDFTPQEIEVTPNPEWPNENRCITVPYELEPLAEGQSYIITFRYTGEFYGGEPEVGDIQLESVTVDGVEFAFDPNAGINYTVTEPVEEIEVAEATEVKYDESHKGRTVNVRAGGVYVVDAENASIGTLNIQPGGQVRAAEPLEVTSLTISHFIPVGKWNTLGIPQADGDIQLGDGLTGNPGIVMRSGYTSPDDQAWETTEELVFEPGTALLVSHEVSDEYLGFHNASSPITIPSPNTTVTTGQDGETNWFHLVANPLWENLTISGRAYVLNADGDGFQLEESPVIAPFQAFMIAGDELMDQVSEFQIDNIPTSNEALAVTGFRVWTAATSVSRRPRLKMWRFTR